MLRRDDLHKALVADRKGALMEHYIRAVTIRLGFEGVKLPWTRPDVVMMPSCHAVAHAYAKAFGARAVNGEHAFFEGREDDDPPGINSFKISSYTHSWNIVELEGFSFILDIFPDLGCPIMPVVLLDPHPSYWVPRDETFRRQMRKLSRKRFLLTVDILADEFLRIDGKNKRGSRSKGK